MMYIPFSCRPRVSQQSVTSAGSRGVRVSVLLISISVLSPNAFALKTDRAAPMDLTAATWKGNTGDGSQLWQGNVRISQGSLKIEADRGTISYQAGQVGSALLEGNPAVVSQDREGGGKVRAQARKIDYDLTLSKVILTGGVKIEENGNITTGERFEYSLDTGAIAGDGGTGQVTMRLVPKVAKPK
jgi:lipopolysaccharide export system protein LptA